MQLVALYPFFKSRKGIYQASMGSRKSQQVPLRPCTHSPFLRTPLWEDPEEQNPSCYWFQEKDVHADVLMTPKQWAHSECSGVVGIQKLSLSY